MGKGYIKRWILNFRTYTNSQCFGKNKNIGELQEAPVHINVETSTDHVDIITLIWRAVSSQNLDRKSKLV